VELAFYCLEKMPIEKDR